MPEGLAVWARPWRSVRVRITLAAALVAALAMVVAGWLVLRAVDTTQTDKLNADARKRMEAVARQIQAGEDPQVAAESTNPDSPLAVFNPDGKLVGVAPKLFVGNKVTAQDLPLPDDAAKAGKLAGSGEGTATAGGRDPGAGEAGTSGKVTTQVQAGSSSGGPAGLRLVTSRETLRRIDRKVATDHGTFTVVAGVPVDEVQRSVEAVRRSMLLGLPGLVLLVAALAWVLVGRALRPVEAMRREVEAISGSSMHRRVPEPGADDEIGRLARTMNAMLGRLQGAAVRQRQFVSDASHELRSPVAAIRTDVEVALREGGGADWPTVGRAVLVEEDRLERLLADLLLLALGDEDGNGGGPTRTTADTRVDIAALARAEADRGRRVPVTAVVADDPPPPPVAGSSDALARVVANLVDNAARHAREEVRVTVSAFPVAGGPGVRLAVDDDGPGIPEADRERVFERFTRLDDARARNGNGNGNGGDGGGGAGLGLAVVRSVVTRHRGMVRAEAAPGGGARLVVELPARA